MNKETAAAILAQIYFSNVPNAQKKLSGPEPGDMHVSVRSAEIIGRVYAHFLGKLETFATWASQAK